MSLFIRHSICAATIVLAGSLLVGCGRKKEETPAPEVKQEAPKAEAVRLRAQGGAGDNNTRGSRL